jgi:hypothetical protein
MNINPYANKYPGAGAMPQGNPSDGGSGGIGSDSLGTQFRDWSLNPILAQIQTHGTSNAYAFREMFVTTAGTITAVTNGITGTAATTGGPAFEVNGLTTVNSGTVVQLWPYHGEYSGWSFVNPGGAAAVATTCRTVAVAVTCSGTSLEVTYDLIRVVDSTCP